MKTQLSKPVREKASYTKEYKREALELWRASGRSAAKVWACIDLTDSGLGVKNSRNPHEDVK